MAFNAACTHAYTQSNDGIKICDDDWRRRRRWVNSNLGLVIAQDLVVFNFVQSVQDAARRICELDHLRKRRKAS